MRLIGQVPDLFQGREFSAFLKKEGIENECEVILSESGGKSSSRIWVYDEDQVEEALLWYERFTANPTDTRFYGHIVKPNILEETTQKSTPPTTPPRPIKAFPFQRNPKGKITILLLIICIAVFIWEEMSLPSIPIKTENTFLPAATLLSKAQVELQYDYPYFYELASKIYRLYPIDQIQDPSTGPPELRVLLNTLAQTTYWKGAYSEFFTRYRNPTLGWDYNGPMFEKISQGQIWRLVTPIVLHADLFHIFFNIIWLMVLGNQIEKRIGAFRYILFIIAAAIISNTAEYLMSGPNFLGLSGVVVAMAGFIWSRQQKAPWEGYFLHRSTMLFITLFVFAMFALQLISFGVELFGGPAISPGIANTAHLSGGFFGLLLGRWSVFAWKVKR